MRTCIPTWFHTFAPGVGAAERRPGSMGITDSPCARHIATNFGLGATLGASIGAHLRCLYCHSLRVILRIGAVYGTWDAFRFKVRRRGSLAPSWQQGRSCTAARATRRPGVELDQRYGSRQLAAPADWAACGRLRRRAALRPPALGTQQGWSADIMAKSAGLH
ncbi:hypothetical protein QJQ45_029610 [Haematococcus lacustris]|nr:hypothetical protein QJQ45_029610 [Haematococcus lacustris]